jgi:hypothetical protein
VKSGQTGRDKYKKNKRIRWEDSTIKGKKRASKGKGGSKGCCVLARGQEQAPEMSVPVGTYLLFCSASFVTY